MDGRQRAGGRRGAVPDARRADRGLPDAHEPDRRSARARACSTPTRWSIAQGVYEGQRAAAPDQRVLILTRSGFAGMQRYAAASWSGDISSTWTAMRKQIPAGLGFSLSGMPYWTLRHRRLLGARPLRGTRRAARPTLDEWRELATRWFEFATFVPILRVHGQAPKREMWEFGGDGSPAYQAMLKFDRLRYRLLPYVYSLAAARHARGRHDHAAAGHGFSGDAPARRRRSVHVRARADGQPGDDLQGARPRGRTCRRPRAAGTTSGRARAVAAAAGHASRRRSTPFRFTSARARSSRSGPSCNTPTRSRPIRSRCSSTPAATARSRCTRTTASATATRRARSRRFRFAGRTRRGP